jgi:hypothetical protein
MYEHPARPEPSELCRSKGLLRCVICGVPNIPRPNFPPVSHLATTSVCPLSLLHPAYVLRVDNSQFAQVASLSAGPTRLLPNCGRATRMAWSIVTARALAFSPFGIANLQKSDLESGAPTDPISCARHQTAGHRLRPSSRLLRAPRGSV